VECNKVAYIFLATKTLDKPFCTFYITDGFQDFWLARFEASYFQETFKNMSLETDFRNAIRSIAEALGNQISLKITHDNEALIETKIQIEGSITLKHTFKLTLNINAHIS
jgi:hypothetical protein